MEAQSGEGRHDVLCGPCPSALNWFVGIYHARRYISALLYFLYVPVGKSVGLSKSLKKSSVNSFLLCSFTVVLNQNLISLTSCTSHVFVLRFRTSSQQLPLQTLYLFFDFSSSFNTSTNTKKFYTFYIKLYQSIRQHKKKTKKNETLQQMLQQMLPTCDPVPDCSTGTKKYQILRTRSLLSLTSEKNQLQGTLFHCFIL